MKKLFFLLFLLSLSCENPITGYGPQPIYIDEHGHVPKLNVFGILRPDSLVELPQSYIHLEGSYSVQENEPDDTDIPDATVIVIDQNASTPDSIHFIYTNLEKDIEPEYRNKSFFPTAGKTFSLYCYKNGWPVLTARTTIPDKPHIKENSLKIENDSVSFEIMPDSLAGMYDIYCGIDGKEYFKRTIKESDQKRISIPIDAAPKKGIYLKIIAYDHNMTEYITSPVILKLNTYQPPISTVENGYGVFGALNIWEGEIFQNTL